MPNIAQPETIDALFMELHEADFVYRTRMRVKEDREGNVVKR